MQFSMHNSAVYSSVDCVVWPVLLVWPMRLVLNVDCVVWLVLSVASVTIVASVECGQCSV